MSASDLEQREIIMMKCLRHDSFSIVSETPAKGGERLFAVELRKGTSAKSDFIATPGPQSRWYLREFQPATLNIICTSK